MAFILIVPFLLIITVSPSIGSAHFQECAHPLPFLEKTAAGIDITKIDFYPIGPKDSQDGLVENVFTYTCNGGKWHDDGDSTEYDVPDEFTYKDAIRGRAGARSRFAIEHNMVQVKNRGWGLVEFADNSIYKKLFSQNRKYQSLLQQHFNAGQIFAAIEDAPDTGSFFVRPQVSNRSLSSEFFRFYMQKLPPKYEDNPAIYQEFVQRFGTHYFKFGTFGFDRYLQFAINQQYAIEHSDEQMTRNIRIAFYREFNVRTVRGEDILEHENGTVQVDEDFDKNSQVILSFGGKTSKWIDKVSGQTFVAENTTNERVFYRLVLEDMDKLIYNENIKAQVQIAIRMYLIKAYLGELKNVYNYTNYQLSDKEKESLVQVETMLKENDTRNMDQMEETIDHIYAKVVVFADRKSCYPALYDLYVTANVKSDFAQSFCAFTWAKWLRGDRRHCVNGKIYYAQNKVNDLFRSYENEKQGLECVKEVRWFNLKYDILNERDNGLKVNCTPC